MPTIKFTATPELPFDIAHLGYKAGDVLEMSDASARRWVRRGVAEYHVGVAKEMPRMDIDAKVAAFTEAVYAVEDSIIYGSDDSRTPAGILNSHPACGESASFQVPSAAEPAAFAEDCELVESFTATDEAPTEPKRRGRPRR